MRFFPFVVGSIIPESFKNHLQLFDAPEILPRIRVEESNEAPKRKSPRISSTFTRPEVER